MNESTVSRIRELRERHIFLGTSSWKYPGWKGLVYRKPYVSEKAFNDSCLAEYAEHFSAVGVDHTYYAWPLPQTFEKYVEQTPESFRFGLKVTEKITVFQYPKLKRYGKDAGQRNSGFLDPALFLEAFFAPLERFRSRLGPVMLEFSQFHPGTIGSGREFLERLDRFFDGVKDAGLQLAVELRNQNWLQPDYFALLCRHRVGHVINSWTRMPAVLKQVELCGPHPLPFLTGRLLLQPGTKYAEAVEAFSPYDRIQEEHPALRDGGVALIRSALQRGVPAYVFVNNRAEGCAPQTIEGILERIELSS